MTRLVGRCDVIAGATASIDNILPSLQSLLSKSRICQVTIVSLVWWDGGYADGSDSLAGRRLFFFSGSFGPDSSECIESTWSTPRGESAMAVADGLEA